MIFYKYAANQNHFIITHDQLLNPNLAERLCSFTKGIGADGIINIKNLKDIEIYNKDGTTAKMCGNGLQCVAMHLNDLTSNTKMQVNIENQVIDITYQDNKAQVFFKKPTFIKKSNNVYEGYFIDCLNSHFIIFSDDVDNFPIKQDLIDLVNDYEVNVEIIKIIDKNNVKMRIYEYGVGETLACGSGSIAVAFLLKSFNLISDDFLTISSKGGKVNITIKDDIYILEGRPKFIFKGEINDES